MRRTFITLLVSLCMVASFAPSSALAASGLDATRVEETTDANLANPAALEGTFSLSYSFTGETPAGANAPLDEKEYRAGETVTLVVPTTTATTDGTGAEGTWAFDGWKIDGQGEVVTAVTITDADIAVVGSWTFTAKSVPDPKPNPDLKQNEANEPAWTPFEVEVGSTAAGTAPVDSLGKDGFPEGTKFTWVPTPQYDQVRPWVSINPATGIITATPPADVVPGSYTVRIDVTYPDGTFDTVNTSVSVQAASKPNPSDPTPDVEEKDNQETSVPQQKVVSQLPRSGGAFVGLGIIGTMTTLGGALILRKSHQNKS